MSAESLDPRFVFLLDSGLKIYMWYGKRAKNTFKSKARSVDDLLTLLWYFSENGTCDVSEVHFSMAFNLEIPLRLLSVFLPFYQYLLVMLLLS